MLGIIGEYLGKLMLNINKTPQYVIRDKENICERSEPVTRRTHQRRKRGKIQNMIDFNRPAIVGNELKYIQDAVAQGMLCGDGKYTKLCSEWMRKRFDVNQVFLTTSCTHALEMAAFLSDIQPGDEVIMPSYTFVSTADAFVLRGARIVFTDIRPDTMNIDENLIEQAITRQNKSNRSCSLCRCGL